MRAFASATSNGEKLAPLVGTAVAGSGSLHLLRHCVTRGGEAAVGWRDGAAPEVATQSDAGHDGSALDQDLLSWAARQGQTKEHNDEVRYPPNDTQLLIGVKSAVIQGFASRQLIRQTWAAEDLPPRNAYVVFLGCEPDWQAINASEAAGWREAVRQEKATYKDLLTQELECTDSYFQLVDKVKGFFRWTATLASVQDLAFVMLVDDDVYVRADTLTATLLDDQSVVPRKRFYGGQVVEAQVNTKLPVNRNESQKDFVPYDVFPLTYKPRFATGAHYLLLVDIVHFLARNDRFLRGVGTLEDVSVGFWLLSLLQIRPLYLAEFDNVRFSLCLNSLLAYGDLTRAAMRRMSTDLRAKRSLCNGFSFSEANKVDFQVDLPTFDDVGIAEDKESPLYRWDFRWETSTRSLHIVTSISSTVTNASTSFSFVPTGACFVSVCAELINHIAKVQLKTSIPSNFCYTYRALPFNLLNQTMTESPSASHVYALASNNLRQGSNSPAIVVRLLLRASSWRPLIECLLALSFPEASIVIEQSEEISSDKLYLDPHVIFATADDVEDPTEWQANDFSHLSRMVVLSARRAPVPPAPRWVRPLHRILVVSSLREETHYSSNHMFLPAESLSFIDRRNHSPRALLKPSQLPYAGRVNAVACFGCKYAKEAELLLDELRTHGITVVEEAPAQEPRTSSSFPLDAAVEGYQRFRFAAILSASPDQSVFSDHWIVSAFLAGSIPVYYGHSAYVSWLFNPKAFIDCSLFASLAECAGHVARVRASPDLYEAMRREPPVVNLTAFAEVFSWHPDAQSQNDSEHHCRPGYE